MLSSSGKYVAAKLTSQILPSFCRLTHFVIPDWHIRCHIVKITKHSLLPLWVRTSNVSKWLTTSLSAAFNKSGVTFQPSWKHIYITFLRNFSPTNFFTLSKLFFSTYFTETYIYIYIYIYIYMRSVNDGPHIRRWSHNIIIFHRNIYIYIYAFGQRRTAYKSVVP